MSNPILDEFRLMADDGDIWGDTMSLWFAIAEGLYLHDDELVPAEWEFVPSPLLNMVDYEEDHMVYGEVILDLIDAEGPEPVLYAGRVITRYAHLVKAAGRDY